MTGQRLAWANKLFSTDDSASDGGDTVILWVKHGRTWCRESEGILSESKSVR